MTCLALGGPGGACVAQERLGQNRLRHSTTLYPDGERRLGLAATDNQGKGQLVGFYQNTAKHTVGFIAAP